jgi:tRNA-dihydrouridine synthase
MSKSDIEGVSARQQAENELREESRKANVQLFKEKLRDLKKAKRIVANLEADIAELEVELAE